MVAGLLSVSADLLEEFPALSEAPHQPVRPWGGAGGFNPDYWARKDMRPIGEEFVRVVGEQGRPFVATLVDTYWLAWP